MIRKQQKLLWLQIWSAVIVQKYIFQPLFFTHQESMGLCLSGKWMTRICVAELPWHGEASFSGWQDEGWGSLVSSQDSKQKASEMQRAGWICQCLVPWGAQFRLTLTLHSQDKSLCHSSPSLPRHKFNLSSIIFTEEPEYTRNHRWNGRETFFCTCHDMG